MRILHHDQSGHPFQLQLSRALAQQGHHVRHIYFSSFQTPKGAVERKPGDSERLEIHGLAIDGEFRKYSPVRRLLQERQYFEALKRATDDFQPDVILSGNAAPVVQFRYCNYARRRNIRFVAWVQDLYGVGVRRMLNRRSRAGAAVVGAAFDRLEQHVLLRSNAVVVISEDFLHTLRSWKVPEQKVRVIPNWAPLDEIHTTARDNPWARLHGSSEPCVLYAGTLGLKHNPEILATLAERIAPVGGTVMVISEGLGADYLRQQKQERRIANLHLLSFQPFDQMSNVLGSADLLLAVLEPEAGVFSVPSKVLTYLCAGRPVLLAVPAQNSAARLIEMAAAGVVVPPQTEEVVRAAITLLQDARLREGMAKNARRAAEERFDITRIAQQFEAVLAPALD